MPANPAALSPAQLAALADDVWHIRLGFTASKKVGNAVKRNRARRRLKEIARLHMPRLAKPGYDYVLIARPVAVGCPYDHLVQDLDYALMRLGAHIHRAPKQPFTPRPAPPPRRKR
jgi:ribonuclease P protein component